MLNASSAISPLHYIGTQILIISLMRVFIVDLVYLSSFRN